MKLLGKLFCRTHPNNHFSHDVVFLFSFLQISEVCNLKSIYLVEQWKIRRRNSQAHSILCSHRNQVETSLTSCGHICTQQTFAGLQDVLKTFSRHVLKTSSTHIQHNNFSSFSRSWSWRRLEDVLEDEKLLCWKRVEDVFNTYLEDMSWKQTKCLLRISVSDLTNVNLCSTNPYFINYIWWI